jgi:uncharacterized membrane protein YidH (DUF202 family)
LKAGARRLDEMAFDRTRVAYDRTMMAWIGTATSLITFGFSCWEHWNTVKTCDR